MKCIIHQGSGLDGLCLVERPVPSPGNDEVLVRLRAAGLNHRDLWTCRGNRSGRATAILGSDGAGIIEAIGAGVDDIGVGDPVIIVPSLGWPRGGPAPPDGFEILGHPRDGTLAEYVIVPQGNIAAKPTHLSWSQAAALPLSGLTAYRALFSVGQLAPGQTVVIPGIGGGTALTAFQLAHAAGAQLAVTSTDPDKRTRAEQLGAALAVDSNATWSDAVRGLTGGDGAHLAIESVGRATWSQSLKCLRCGGRLVVYGSTSGDVIDVDLVEVFLQWKSIIGTTMGSTEEFHSMLDLVNRQKLIPIIDREFVLEDGVAALRHLERGVQFGKVVLSVG